MGLDAALVELSELLAANNVRALKSLGKLRALVSSPKLEPELANLEESLLALEFEAARKHLQSIASALKLSLSRS